MPAASTASAGDSRIGAREEALRPAFVHATRVHALDDPLPARSTHAVTLEASAPTAFARRAYQPTP